MGLQRSKRYWILTTYFCILHHFGRLSVNELKNIKKVTSSIALTWFSIVPKVERIVHFKYLPFHSSALCYVVCPWIKDYWIEEKIIALNILFFLLFVKVEKAASVNICHFTLRFHFLYAHEVQSKWRAEQWRMISVYLLFLVSSKRHRVGIFAI